MHKVSQITLPGGLEIELYFQKGQLAYSFDFDGKPYGTKITLPSKSVLDIATCCLILFTNAQETYKELNNSSKRLIFMGKEKNDDSDFWVASTKPLEVQNHRHYMAPTAVQALNDLIQLEGY